MPTESSVVLALSEESLTERIVRAHKRVCFVAPGLYDWVAEALSLSLGLGGDVSRGNSDKMNVLNIWCIWIFRLGYCLTLSVTSAIAGTAPTSIGLSSSLNPSVVGQAVTLTAVLTSESGGNSSTAIVAPDCVGLCSPTNAMTFYDGNTLLGVATSFTAFRVPFTFLLVTTQLTPGALSLSASYPGDSFYAAITSAPLVQTVLPIQITTSSPLPNGSVGSPYLVALATNTGTGQYTWMLSAGSVPPAGLTLSSSGVLSGTPVGAGTTSFTVTVTGSIGVVASATFSITITAISGAHTSFLVKTIAGGYVAGTGASGDGGLALQAQLFDPVSVAVDWLGNVFIADQGNNKIRKVAPTGVITTFAGTGVLGSGGDGGLALAGSKLR
jgi:hypothetical protein